MKTKKAIIASSILSLASILIAPPASAEDTVLRDDITSSACTDEDTLTLENIPVGNFHSVVLPQNQSTTHLTQIYNNSYSQGWCDLPGYPGPNDPRCTGLKIYYGHAGDDFADSSTTPWISVSERGLVLVSHGAGTVSGWGESIIYVTRVNEYSEELLTFHYHHMKNNGMGKDSAGYKTTRQVNACDIVAVGDHLGIQGGTGGWSPHLHNGVRRWKNFAELKKAVGTSGVGVYTVGYAYGNTSSLHGLLEPLRIYYDTFKDFEGDDPPYLWALPYVRDMRHRGIEFGQWDGNYGSDHNVTRAEAARWLKIAARLDSVYATVPTFPDDVPLLDPDTKLDNPVLPYVEALTRHPKPDAGVTVIDPNGTHFYPDVNLTRAQALKMMILSFYADEYLDVYNNAFWYIEGKAALATLKQFGVLTDVGLLSWYATYVYFGVTHGLVAPNATFRPDDPVAWAEMAKWVIEGMDYPEDNPDACANVTCGQMEYCSQGVCQPIPDCVPSEVDYCELGGGYDACQSNPECTPGQEQTELCADTSQQHTRTCSDGCTWSTWSTCEPIGSCTPGTQMTCGNCGASTCDSSGNYGACLNQGECSAGAVQSQVCNVTGTMTQTCSQTCTWGAWSTCSVQTQCTPGQTESQTCTTSQGQSGTQQHTCDANGFWGSWTTCTASCVCSTGACCDGCNYLSSAYICNGVEEFRCQGTNPGDDAQRRVVNTYCTGSSTSCNGQTSTSAWSTYENCSTSQICEMQSGVSHCVPYISCTDQYIASNLVSCKSYTVTGGPLELCLHISQVSGASWRYQICKKMNGSAANFTNEIKSTLYDANYMSQGVWDVYQGTPGSSCTPLKNIDLSYINGYGVINGAGLQTEILSPSDCSQSSCTYNTGVSITVRLECL